MRARIDAAITWAVLVVFDLFARLLNHNPAHPGGAL